MTKSILSVLGAGMFLWTVADAAGQHVERHFAVQGRPVVVIQNIADGRIEVKSWKNPEVVVSGARSSDKISIDMEQAGDRIDVITAVIDSAAQSPDTQANLQLTVPEETELQLKTQTGLIYVEQVTGDMTLESVAGDIHLKEVSGYIIVTTTGGSLVCTQCAGKLKFDSVSGSAQILQPGLTNVNLHTTTGNILFDGDFVRTGLYSMKSGKGLVEVRFSGNDSFDLNAQTATGTVDNQAAAYLKPDSHGVKHLASRFTKGLIGTVGQGLAKVELSSYSGTIRILKRD
jgi:Putative adhesin